MLSQRLSCDTSLDCKVRWCVTWECGLCMLSIPHDPVPQPQNTSGGAFQQSTQDHKMYYRANFSIDKEVPCATLRGEDGSIIVACCILHNLTVNLREPEPEDCDMDGETAHFAGT
ncbi:hypothetical protein pdam_00024171 [Pocillopora damicornis]|uniref:Uncharacterized protein n=1 Tax=Pocillopora damicornis TaxID=46731 RepID=A0A3M6TYY9_POCDA|nr:hypothetical protein pdam_00024171 [Pocillopora damicornis]